METSWNITDDDNDVLEDGIYKDTVFGGKDAVIFLIDCSCSSSSFFSMSMKCAATYLREKILSSPSDAIGVLLYGTQKTVEISDFLHMVLVLSPGASSASSILELEEMAQTGGEEYGSSDTYCLHEALWQCQKLFLNVKGKIRSKQILLLTSNDNPHEFDPVKKRQALKKAIDLRETGVSLEVIPIILDKDVPPFNMSAFFCDMIQTNDDDDDDVNRITNIEQRCLDDLLCVVRKRDHKKRRIGNTTLDLGDGNVKIALCIYNLVQRAVKPFKVLLTRDKNEEVQTKRVLTHPNGTQILIDGSNQQVDRFQEYGGRKIIFSYDEVRSMHDIDSLGLRLCGFKPISRLKWSHYVRPSHFVYPDERSIVGSRSLFAALHRRCLHRSVMIVASFKARPTSGASFVALVPDSTGFHMVFLPFSDDIRAVPDEPHLVEVDPEQLNAAKDIVNKLKIRAFDPAGFQNPDLQAHYRLIEALALGREDIELDPDFTLPPYEKMALKLGSFSKIFNEAVYPSDYEATSTQILKSDGANKMKAAYLDKFVPDEFDMGSYVTDRSVHKLTVNVLKKYLGSLHVADVANKKKSQLVDAVYRYFEGSLN